MRVGLGACVLLVLVIYVQNSIAESPPVIEPPSADCKYKRKAGKYKCDPATSKRSVEMELRTEIAGCAPTKTVSRDCKLPSKVCYDVKATKWGDCQPEEGKKSGTRTRTVNKKSDAPAGCSGYDATKTLTSRCKVNDRDCYDFKSAKWGKCDPKTSSRTKTVSKKADAGEQCSSFDATKTLSRKCTVPDRVCYNMTGAEWSECDPQSTTKTRILSLLTDAPEGCADFGATKTFTRKCKVADSVCYDVKGATWTECVPVAGESRGKRTKTISKKEDAPEGCKDYDATKNIERKCNVKNSVCYDVSSGEWSECVIKEGKTKGRRSKTISKKEDAGEKCSGFDDTKTITRKCAPEP